MLRQENYTIDLSEGKQLQEDYQFLKDFAVTYLQSISKNVWNDFNAGDPGITTLELLCYALTDLAYRTQLPLEDLLTEKENTTPFNKNNSFTANEILTHNPLTVSDYRSLILDQFPEIRNIWFYPITNAVEPIIYIHKNKKDLTLEKNYSFQNKTVALNGLYQVKIETIENSSGVAEKVDLVLQNHRNLCEDFECVDLVDFEFVTTCMDIDLDGTVKPETVQHAVYKAIYNYISPELNHYSLLQLLEKGYSIEEIFHGPELKNGFFDPAELENFEKKNVLYVSDLINILTELPGIANIRKIHLNSYGSTVRQADFNAQIHKDEEYCLHLQDSTKVFRFYVDTPEKKGNKINFHYRNLKLYEKIEIIEKTLYEPRIAVPDVSEEWENVKSNYRDIKPYYSIQNEFPKAYLIGQEGITEFESDKRKIERLQFKGYLLHFEQLMADYLAQLENFKNLYSWSSKADYRSYLYQSLDHDEILDLETIITQTPDETEGTVEKYDYTELFDSITNDKENDDYHDHVLKISPEENFDRRNRFLNHLIARFNDSFVEFSIIEFFKKNGKTYRKRSIVADKKSYIRTFPIHTGQKLRAVNYKKPIWNLPNISGYQMRVAKKLGLTNFITADPDLIMTHSLVHPVLDLENINNPEFNNFYSYNDKLFDLQFGFHLVEHILLRPRSKKGQLIDICVENDEDIENCFCKDPYSFRVTAVLPGWLPISLDSSFREYVEQVFREELPAHISLKLCWVSPKKMLEFEKNYFLFMKQLEQKNISDCISIPEIENPKLAEFIDTLQSLENVYYPSHLVDCEDINFDSVTSESDKHPTVLSKTMLNAQMTFGVTWETPEDEIWEICEDFNNIIHYLTTENGTEFFINHQEIKLKENNILSVELLLNENKNYDIILGECPPLKGKSIDESIYTMIKLINLENQEEDLLWCKWKDKTLKILLNKQLTFEITFAETTKPTSAFHINMQHNAKNALYKISKTNKSLYYSQSALEKIWLENQHNPDFPLPKTDDFEIVHILKIFLENVKKTTTKAKKQNKPK